MPVRRRRAALVLAVVLVGSLIPSVAAARATAPTGGTHIPLGADGRLTVLVVGSDWRPPPAVGDRLDVVMVASLDPKSHTIAAVSIPRDTIRIKRHVTNGGGTSGDLRVNYMYDALYFDGSCNRKCALDRFRKDIAATLALEIDYYAYLRFTGFDALIDELGGVEMDIPKSLRDKGYNDDSGGPLPYGVFFPAAIDYRLGGASEPNCPDWHVDCTRALPYVRSRHGLVGTASNSDWNRSSRQQIFLMAAVRTVTGLDPGSQQFQDLQAAIADPSVNVGITTDLPTDPAAALELFGWLNGATFAGKVVLKPDRWAFRTSDMPAYTYRLRTADVRAWVDGHMPPVP